ncbi:MAG: F0F1 ATP synthase subunit delta, partial [Flavobacteriales bacterium]|nr:F0F1 ATP synthase subunit delta [Flavobacteriales bacterium]
GAKETSLKEVVNPDVIGGLVVRVGDLQVDATIATALNRIDQHFKKNSYIADF